MTVDAVAPELDPTVTERWRPWCVRPDSGFEVDDPRGEVAVVQIDVKRFLVMSPFRFSDVAIERALIRRMHQAGRTAEEAERAVDDARTFTPDTENPTDLASIPRFMRWFENSYGAHTLAAILHDNLIVDTPNGGALRSDSLADRFFRDMMRSAGVPWLKRWIMWSAVALRSRWAAGGVRRASVALWVVAALIGMTSFAWAVGVWLFSWADPVGARTLLMIALGLPLLASPLWGRQIGASFVGAIGALWILPAAVFGGLGWLVYRGLEWASDSLGLR